MSWVASANRLFVDADVADEFTRRFVAAMADIRIGAGFDTAVTCEPLIHDGAVDKVKSLVDEAVGAGAVIELGGNAPDGPGSF